MIWQRPHELGNLGQSGHILNCDRNLTTMARKHFWFKFEWDKWRDDSQLRRCSKEAKGFWIDCIALMEKEDTWFIEGTPEEICRDVVATMDEFERSIAEFQRTKAVSVSKSQGRVKLVSRKILKAVNLTEYNKLKKRESRSQKRVKVESNSISKEIEILESSSKEEDIEHTDAACDLIPLQVHLGEVLVGAKKVFGVERLLNEGDWIEHGTVAFQNKFTSQQFVECLSLLHDQEWRTSAVKGKHVNENLPSLAKLRREGSRNGKLENLPSAEQKLVDDAEHRGAIKAPPKIKTIEGVQ